MNRAALLIGIVAGFSLAVGTGCLGEAPHDNPVDPGSEGFVREGTLTGLVTDRAGAPLPEAEARLIPGSAVAQPELVTRTDSRGRFILPGAKEGAGYRLLVSKDGYDAVVREALAVRAGISEELPTVRLNALPGFTNAALRTIHLSRWWPTNDLFFLEVNADVADADGLLDIDRVWLDIPDLGFTVTLDPQAQPAGRFEKLIRADSLPTASLQSLLGRPLRLNVRDKEGGSVSSAPRQLVRVLEETPIPTAPGGDVLLETNRPTLTWEPFPPRFAFTYRIDVFRDEVNRVILAQQVDEIPMDVTTLELQSALPTGPYFWTVTVVDAFGNQSGSKEAAFRIP